MGKARKLVIALDVPEAARAKQLVAQLGAVGVGAFKVGLELFHAAGPDIVRWLSEQGYRVFLDLKYHDIPTTVQHTVRQTAKLGVWMLNVHALGGLEMMSTALKAAQESKTGAPLVVGVTVLTHLESAGLHQLGLGEPELVVARLARLAHQAGLDGVVCSPHEVQAVKRLCGSDFLTVTPGIRPAGSTPTDQRRVATPEQAVAAGADYLVVGRPITKAADPAAAALEMIAQLKGANPSETGT